MKEDVSMLETTWIMNNDLHIVARHFDNTGFVKEEMPDIVLGDFSCGSLGIESLKNCSKEIHGCLFASYNNLSNLHNFPKLIKGSIYLSKNSLTSLKGLPNKVKNLYLRSNQLTTLKYCPEFIEGEFAVNYNPLTNLKHSPKKVKTFQANNNPLTSLNHIPKAEYYIFNNLNNLDIEIEFVKKGYTNYYEDLLTHCIENNYPLSAIETWPENFLKEEIIESNKGMVKFNL